MVDDFNDFQRLSKALLSIGFSEKQREEIFKTLSGILHLGNVKFEDSNDSKGRRRLVILL